jgi:hypothetical protein
MLTYFAVPSAMSVALGNLIPMIIELSRKESRHVACLQV